MNSVAMATQEVEFLLNNPRNNKKPKFRKSILVFKSCFIKVLDSKKTNITDFLK